MLPPLPRDPEMAPISILSWNILEGGHDPTTTKTASPTLDQARQDLLVEQVKDTDPDIVVFNEALWCRPSEGRHVPYAQQFGYPHFICDTYDGPWGNIIMSRYPIIDQRRFRIHNRGGLVAHVQTPGGRMVVATYHPHPSRYPAHKARDFRNLLWNVDGPIAVCGDFNAISPEDAPDEIALALAFAAFSEHPATSCARFTEGGRMVFDRLAKMGFSDAIPPQGRLPTMPTDMRSLDKAGAMRIDHIWINQGLRTVEGCVLRHPRLEHASDHYPVWARLAIR